MTIRQIDHIVILVNELDQAIADYGKLGFTVFPGGEHPGGATHNALIVFADGTYFELIAFLKPSADHIWWGKGLENGEGLVDYALLPGDIVADIAAARQRGLEIAGPLPGGRLRPDGVRVEWQTGRAEESSLPFFCFDITPRNLRVPEGAVRQHANGASGIAAVTVAVEDLAAGAALYRQLLGGDGAPGDGRHSVSFPLGAGVIRLVEAADDPAMSGHVRLHGGIFAVELRFANGGPGAQLDRELAHGARISAA